MKNKVILAIIIIVLMGGAYFGGTLATKKSNQATYAPGEFGSGRMMGGIQGRNNLGRNNLNFISGEVISKDENSLTIKMRDGSTKNVFYSSSTKISKQAEGAMTDVAVGTNVMVNGDANQDGSVGAKDIQIRSEMFAATTTPTSTETIIK